jgi:hypothetical protein
MNLYFGNETHDYLFRRKAKHDRLFLCWIKNHFMKTCEE